MDNLVDGKNIDCIYLDFAKAYDLVDLSVLLVKTKNMGIGGRLMVWLWEFLRDRNQKVRVENWLSHKRRITSACLRDQ